MTAPTWHVVLYEPEIPQNAGNVGRTCVALNAKLWLVQPLGFQLDDRRLQRAGLDYWKDLQWQIVPHWSALTAVLGPETRYWFFTKRASTLFWDVRYTPGDVLVFGSESRGLPSRLLDRHTSQAVSIPQIGPVRSLNLATAAAVALYEAARQNRPC